MKKRNKCIVPYCSHEQHSRGLCGVHYSYINRLINQGKYKEKDLIARGKLLEKTTSKNTPRGQTQRFMNWLEEK